MNKLTEKKISIEHVYSHIEPLLRDCVGMAVDWLGCFNDFSASALVPENITNEHLLDFDKGGLPEISEKPSIWLSAYLKKEYHESIPEYILVLQDVWAENDDCAGIISETTRIAGKNGVYYYMKINPELINNLDHIIYSGISFFSLGFIVKEKLFDKNIALDKDISRKMINYCKTVFFSAYDQESFLLFHKHLISNGENRGT